MKPREEFGSRLGMMLAMLGMAVGTGNIWRFPRIVAQNGGGEFLIPWVAFLFLWSIPLVLVEFGMGHKTRSGPVSSFIQMMGPRWAWMGAFTAFVAAAITFYYAVITGWTLRYSLASITGELPEQQLGALWVSYTQSWWPVLTHGIAIGLATLVVARGVKAIERVARVLMPLLLLLVIALALRAVTLPGAREGLSFMYTIEWGELLRAELWVQALTQNAWDTGAGFSLVLCYAAYLRANEDTTLNAFILPTANNVVSLIAGTMVLCTVFAVVPTMVDRLSADPGALAAYPALSEAMSNGEPLTTDLMQETIFESGNEGLTFIWMPQLFATIPGGQVFMTFFFVALAFAAFTSLVALTEVGVRVLIDAGASRKTAIRVVGSAAFLLGLPSAISLRVLHNQDWVWGVALLISGLFFAIAVTVHGARRFRQQHLNHEHSDVRVGSWWDLVITVFVPVQAVILLAWWIIQAGLSNERGWLNPLSEDNAGTVLFQFAVVFLVLIGMNRWLARQSQPADEEAQSHESS